MSDMEPPAGPQDPDLGVDGPQPKEPGQPEPPVAFEEEPSLELFAGRYMLGQVLGRGGTCTVQRAWDTRLNRHVAIKRLQPPLDTDEHARARFSREGRAIARLSHPNLVTLIDRGGADEADYLVFEYIEGRSLKDLLKSSGPLAPQDAGQIAGQVAEGLSHAHAHGIIHRDVKPQNILLDAEGRAKLTDFGIATGEDWTRVTREGSIVGSSRYMSPEQVQGRPIDGRTDIYSLGIVLYEMLAGVPPFEGTSIAEVGRQHLRERPRPLGEVVADLPPGVERVVMRCLEKLPENRFQSADELLGALVGSGIYTQPKSAGSVFAGIRLPRGRDVDTWVPPPGTEAPAPPDLDEWVPLLEGEAAVDARRRSDIMRERRERDRGGRRDRRETRARRSGPSVRTLVAVVGILVILVAGWWLLFGRSTEAPDLVGITLDEANVIAEDAGLKVEVFQQVLDLDREPGTVMEQEPAVGEAVEGGTMRLTVTREPIPVTVTAVEDYDPEGDNEENPQLLELLIDGSDETAWMTEQYGNPDFGNLPKTGVGVTFSVDAPATVMEVVSASEGWAADVISLADDGTAATVGTLTGLTRQVLVFDEPITAGRIWITKLAPGDNGKFDVKLSEVRFFR